MFNSISYNTEMHRLELELSQMFELSEEEEASLGPLPKSLPLQEGSVPNICFSEESLMQRIWSGESQVNSISDNISDRTDENLEDKSTAETLRMIQQRFSFGNAALPSDENSNSLQNRARIVQLEEEIQKTKELIKQKETAIDQELNDMRSIIESFSTIAESTDEEALLPQSLTERLVQHQKEQTSVMQVSDKALLMIEQDLLALGEKHCELEELSDEVELIQKEAFDLNKELIKVNQLAIERNLEEERKRREEIALQEQVTTLTATFSELRADQVEIGDGINELAERQFEVENQYEEMQVRRDLEYPHLYATVNLGNQLNRISSQMREIPGFVRAASIFLWENFTHIAWKTVELISNLGRAIFRMVGEACSYVIQKAEEIVFGWVSIPALVAMGAASLSLSQITGSPLAFGATAVSGYFLLRRLF